MEITLGIDLGTTFSAVAYIDDEGNGTVIPNTDGFDTTPSVIWFNGKTAYVGKKANDRKILPTSPVFEFIKRDIGKPRSINTRYEVDGFYYGAVGISAIILRKLKKEAFLFFKNRGLIPREADERSFIIPAVITVPAYFGDIQRNETRNAGISAGLDVVNIINEPTAAALAYGNLVHGNRRIMVFDLGGGTFDVTILDVLDGERKVIASDGADQLGGKDWDELIIDYLYSEYYKRTGRYIPDDFGWEIQQKAMDAKLELSVKDQTIVTIGSEERDVEITLYQNGKSEMEMEMDTDIPFYFNERSENLLSLCRTICLRLLDKAGLTWGDIDEIILAGGSCRMPMIPKMLENISGREIRREILGFSFDTSIAIGAAYSAVSRNKVKDVTSKTIGIEILYGGIKYIEHTILKNTPLPAKYEDTFPAVVNAILKIYEGDSHRTDESVLRGRLELENPPGFVLVKMNIDINGVLSASVEYPVDIEPDLRIKRGLIIKTDEIDIDLEILRNKIASLDIRL